MKRQINNITQRTQAIDRRLTDLQRRVASWTLAPEQRAALDEGFQDLNTALEELHVTQEELLVQNEALAQAHQQLADEQRRYRELFEYAPDAYFVTDAAGTVVEANHFAAALLNLELRLLVRKPLITFVAPADRARFREEVASLAANDGLRHGQFRLRPRRRPEFDAQVAASAVKDVAGKITAIRWVVRDVSQIADANRQLRDYQHRLRSLAAELSLAEERERRRIAVEIHDRISQTIAIARMKVAQMQAAANPKNVPTLREVMQLLEQSLEDSRTLTFELSPPVLYELGLTAALQWLADQAQRRHGLKVVVDGDIPAGSLPEETRVVLFQAVRELLMNIVKHAKATAARVSVRQVAEGVRLTVADDGCGFDHGLHPPTGGSDRGGFGLFSIRTRIEQLGGKYEISSVPDEGTRVTLLTPFTNTSAKMRGGADGDENSAGRRPPDRARGAQKSPPTA